MIKLFKITAFLEGISLLALLFNMLVFKPYFFDIYKQLLFPIGLGHGVLFIAYVFLIIYLKALDTINWKVFFISGLASFIPFGTFYIEKKYF